VRSRPALGVPDTFPAASERYFERGPWRRFVSIASIAVSAMLQRYGGWVLAMTAMRLVDRAWNDHAAAGRESLEARLIESDAESMKRYTKMCKAPTRS